MCLIIKDFKSSNTDLNNYVKIAKRNISTYKVLYKDYSGLYRTKYQAIHIEVDGHFQSVEIFKSSFSTNKIGQGIHSCLTLKQAKRHHYGAPSRIIVKCFIPAGTPYILGKENEVVSLGLFIEPIDKKGIVKLKK